MFTSVTHSGEYEFLETADGDAILSFDGDFYSQSKDGLPQTLVETRGDHDITRICERGDFVWLQLREVERFAERPHLFLRERGEDDFREFLISQDGDRRVLVATNETLKSEQVEEYVALSQEKLAD